MEDQLQKCLMIHEIATHSRPIICCYFEEDQQCHLELSSREDNYSCRRWTREYLPFLQQRQKWNKPQRNLAVNDTVLLLDENTPHSIWPLGRVTEVYSNHRDGLVRSAKVKTRSMELVRPVGKISLLESSAEDAINASKDQ